MSIELTATERRTREIFSDVQIDTPSAEIMVGKVFIAMYTAALTADKVNRIAAAMFGYETLDLQAALTSLTKQKKLRSRVSQGRRWYEVNY